jgi:hypothetical protein
VLVYLDICCLKRPFDDQTQARVRLEAEAVLALLALDESKVRFVRSPAPHLENSRNPVKERASRVEEWLVTQSMVEFDPKALERRTAELMQMGFKNFDALHVASAEQAGADVLASCDDGIRATSTRNNQSLKVRILSPIELAQEVLA